MNLPFHRIRIGAIVAVFLSIFKITAQNDTLAWQTYQSPIFSNLNAIHQQNDSIFVYSTKGIIYKTANQNWKLFLTRKDFQFDAIFMIDSNHIFVAENNDYQESVLFYWNGKVWREISNPVANTISDMYFNKAGQGIILSFGEIVLKEDAHYKHITPPTNGFISNLVVNSLDDFYVLDFGKGIFHYRSGNWHLLENTAGIRFVKKIRNRIFVLNKDILGEIIDNQFRELSKNPLWEQVHSISLDNNGGITGVGDAGLIVLWDKGINTSQKRAIIEDLQDVICLDSTCIAVGDDGSIITNKILPYTLQNKKQWKGFEKKYFKQFAKIVDDEYGVVIADFNGDGKPDIFTCGLFEQEHLYINESNGIFSDKAEEFGITMHKNELNLGACAADIDNDGYIDLYVSSLNAKNSIYKNINGTHFIEYSQISGGIGESTDRTNGAVFADIDKDGDLDLFITNENSTNRLYRNNGVGIFKEITYSAGLKSKFGGNSASFADIDNDGDEDLFITNWSTGNKLYKNRFVESGQVFFEDCTEQSRVAGASYAKSNACVFSDIDNDADLDLFVTNRKTSNNLYINNGKGIFTENSISKDTAKSYGALIADFNLDGQKDIYISNVGQNTLFINNRGVFLETSSKYNADVKGYSTGSALIDYDNDNDWDIYVSNYVGRSSTLLQNKGNATKNTISVRLKAYHNNRNAIGSKIYVYANKSKDSLLYFDEIIGGSGYVSMNETKQIIPIKQDSVTVKLVFPNNIVKTIKNINRGDTLFIEDVVGFKKYLFLLKNLIRKQFLDPHNLFMLLKFILVIMLLSYFLYKIIPIFYYPKVYVFLITIFLFSFYVFQSLYFEFSPFFLSGFLPLFGILVLTLLIYTFFEKRFLREQALAKQNQIKSKLSRDLHDDLSATISSIGFYLAVVKVKVKDNQNVIREILFKAESLVQNAGEALTDLIWAINPKPEYLKNVVLRLQNTYQDIFTEKGIHFILNWNIENKHKTVLINTKQNIFLILKEAITNSLKYADASEISITVNKIQQKTQIIIADNGKGFITEKAASKGHGLFNMNQRALEIGGLLSIDTQKGKGTSITLFF